MHERQRTGSHGEALVAAHLERQGFAIVARNARAGRLEIDLIAKRGSLLVFCEVRARTSRAFMDPIASIDHRKAQRIRAAAAAWLREHRVRADEIRFDAASVVLEGEEPEIAYYESAF